MSRLHPKEGCWRRDGHQLAACNMGSPRILPEGRCQLLHSAVGSLDQAQYQLARATPNDDAPGRDTMMGRERFPQSRV